MSAGIYKAFIEQGATFELVCTWRNPDRTPINLTGYSATMTAATTKGAAKVIDVSDVTGEIVLGGAAGTVSVTIPASATSLLAPGAYVYEINLASPGGIVTRMIEGPLLIDGRV
jgi:hypothetical protein